jgi:hypothetical protein
MKLREFNVGRKVQSFNGRLIVDQPLQRFVAKELPTALPELSFGSLCRVPQMEWHIFIEQTFSVTDPSGNLLFEKHTNESPRMTPGLSAPWVDVVLSGGDHIVLKEPGQYQAKVIVKGAPDFEEQIMIRSFVVELMLDDPAA